MRLYVPSRQHQASYAVDTRFNFSVCKVTGAWNRRLTFVNAVIKTRGALRSTLTSLQALQAVLSLSYISATCSLLLSRYVVSITDIAVYYLSRPVSWVMDSLKSALSLSFKPYFLTLFLNAGQVSVLGSRPYVKTLRALNIGNSRAWVNFELVGFEVVLDAVSDRVITEHIVSTI
jgi:hypothetical protein